MSDRFDRLMPDFSDASLESIWAKYSATTSAPPPAAAEKAAAPSGSAPKSFAQMVAEQTAARQSDAIRAAKTTTTADAAPTAQHARDKTKRWAKQKRVPKEKPQRRTRPDRTGKAEAEAPAANVAEKTAEPAEPAPEAQPKTEPVSAAEPAPRPAPTRPSEAPAAEDAPVHVPQSAEDIAARSRRIVMSALGKTLRQYRQEGMPDEEPEIPFPAAPKETTSRAADGSGDAAGTAEDSAEAVEADSTGTAKAEAAADAADEWIEETPPIDVSAFEPDEDDVRIAEPHSSSHRPVVPSNEPTRKFGSDVPGSAPKPEPPKRRPRVTMGEDGIITLYYDSDDPAPVISVIEEEEPPEDIRLAPAYEEEYDEDEEDEEYDEDEDDEVEDEVELVDDKEQKPSRPTLSARLAEARRSAKRTAARSRASFSEKVLDPAVRIFALQIARRQMQKKEAASWPDPVEVHDTPELSPKKAAQYYADQSKRLRLRLRVSLLMTVMLAWIALGMPMGGMLGRSLALQAGVSLVLTLTVLVAALDVTAAGLRQVFDLAPGPEALAVFSALISCVDAALTLSGYGETMPFCAVGAAAMTAALWGEQLYCRALMRTFRTASAAREPSCVMADPGNDKTPSRLYRTEKNDLSGFVRRSESQDLCRTAYAAAAPIMLLAALILSVSAAVASGGK